VKRIRCKTEKISLFGEFFEEPFEFFIEKIIREISKSFELPDETISHLVKYYGLRSYELIDLISRNKELSLKIHPDYPDVIGQIFYSLYYEDAHTAMDILLRRTTIGTGANLGLDSVEKVVMEMGKYFHWGKDRVSFEIDRYNNYISSHFLIK
jgi:glycerol-3-phosphate dehydrogenase